MKSRMIPLLALVAVLIAGCNQAEEEPLLDPLSADEISGERLWQRITEESEYENYGFWPGHEGFSPGQAPHGPVHRIFVNKPLLSALPLPDKTAPVGTVVVKENYSTDRDLTAYTVMAKVEGFNPEAGDWYWARYAPDGTVGAAGAVESCIACHAGLAENDYIIVYPLAQAPQGE